MTDLMAVYIHFNILVIKIRVSACCIRTLFWCLSWLCICSVLNIYEEHQKLLNDLGAKKRGAENGWEKQHWQYLFKLCFSFHVLIIAVPFYRLSDGDDPEKISKMDDGSATAACQQAVPPTMPPVPPPPVMGGDMSGYGNYSTWYQVCRI